MRTPYERLKTEQASLELNCTVHPLEILRPRLARLNVTKAKDLSKVPDGSVVRVAGTLVTIHTPPTRSGRRVMFVTLEDETGLIDLVFFPDVQDRCAKELFTREVLIVEGQIKKEGQKGQSISIVAKKMVSDPIVNTSI